jgi:hypothetical protein
MTTRLYVCTLTAALVAGLSGWGLGHGSYKVRVVKADNNAIVAVADFRLQ